MRILPRLPARLRSRRRPWRAAGLSLGLALSLVAFQAMQAQAALACGGLVAPNGSVRLDRAATLIAWHNGIEQYMTSFTYEGDVKNLGWIVPLPAVPLSIKEGGAWTLQRLSIETHPQPVFADAAGAASEAPSAVQVLQQVKVEALNITVLKGSGQAVLDWCAQNGFTVEGDTRAHLLAYAQGSPIFMAVKYDTAAAQARHQTSGDGAPLLITMRTPHPWVPLEVLALDGQIVHADLYFLTDEPLNTSAVASVAGVSAVGGAISGAPGLQVAFQEKLTPTLYHDLSTDRNMGWVRADSWLTYLTLDAPAEAVTYDLNVTPDGVFRLSHFGDSPTNGGASIDAAPGWIPRLPPESPQTLFVLGFALAMCALLGAALWRKRRLDATAR
ncbi:MAG: DUF2330 domain-containing protein [Chloroflexota bacterium]|nr:DUF2330 domain-containing protein [Chloroflexota bacterium]